MSNEEWWSRGDNFCVREVRGGGNMTTDGFKGFKGPKDVSGSPLHSLNTPIHHNPSILTLYNIHVLNILLGKCPTRKIYLFAADSAHNCCFESKTQHNMQ